MSDGQEKSPFSDSLATEENGLGIENSIKVTALRWR